MEAAVLLERHQRPGVVVVRMNRPEHHNALNGRLVRELTDTFHQLADDEQTRAVILTGNGRSFCAGADLKGVKETSRAGLELAQREGQALYDLMNAVNECPVPVIGRINGWALGGGAGLVSCCDLVVASEGAKFGFSEVRLGLIPAVITPFVLSRISATDARELYLTGERFDAYRAREIGLVDRVASEGDVDDTVEEWTGLLLQGAPGAQAAIKALLRRVPLQGQVSWREYTSSLFAQRVISDEGKEGIQAFLDKRKATWDISEQSD